LYFGERAFQKVLSEKFNQGSWLNSIIFSEIELFPAEEQPFKRIILLTITSMIIKK